MPSTPVKHGECPFCDPNEFGPRMVLENAMAYAMFSLWPASPYHSLLVPKRHVENERELTDAEILSIFAVKRSLVDAVERKTGLSAYNFGVNIGSEAGQTYAHLHYHVIFRQDGDVPDPRGGVRNIVSKPLDYVEGMEGRDEVEVWTAEIREALVDMPRPAKASAAK